MMDSDRPLQLNSTLLTQHDLGGYGNLGEGMAMQCLPQGRRILWLGHESAPKNFTAVDVTDPQLNDVFVDNRAIVYTVDRHSGGLYILEMTF